MVCEKQLIKRLQVDKREVKKDETDITGNL